MSIFASGHGTLLRSRDTRRQDELAAALQASLAREQALQEERRDVCKLGGWKGAADKAAV
jgi:hypothetical protein